MPQTAIPGTSPIGLIIVDHGSRRPESNQMLHEFAQRFAARSEYSIVEPAHMELAEPSITQAFARCVARGAGRIVVFPYFLSPGRHWTEDIPSLTASAARSFPGVTWLVTAPFALHPGMLDIVSERVRTCLAGAIRAADRESCDFCRDTAGCHLRQMESPTESS
jgi:sirohydrochlorin ferrochelatase